VIQYLASAVASYLFLGLCPFKHTHSKVSLRKRLVHALHMRLQISCHCIVLGLSGCTNQKMRPFLQLQCVAGPQGSSQRKPWWLPVHFKAGDPKRGNVTDGWLEVEHCSQKVPAPMAPEGWLHLNAGHTGVYRSAGIRNVVAWPVPAVAHSVLLALLAHPYHKMHIALPLTPRR
jgi:hypothetical protein